MTVVAIDGPAGAGKSSVARAVADRLGFTYLDSGAMYRCVALAVLRRGLPPAEVAAEVSLSLGDRVLLDGEDVTAAIRAPEVSEAASVVAADAAYGPRWWPSSGACWPTGDWVAEGRDIGTVVWPSAEVKVFLTASPAARAGRRAEQIGADVAVVLAEQAIRDQRDTERDESPLRAAADAVTVDTSDLTLDQAVEQVVALVRAATL